MGHYSPIVKQMRGGAKPQGMVLVVGTCADGVPAERNRRAGHREGWVLVRVTCWAQLRTSARRAWWHVVMCACLLLVALVMVDGDWLCSQAAQLCACIPRGLHVNGYMLLRHRRRSGLSLLDWWKMQGVVLLFAVL